MAALPAVIGASWRWLCAVLLALSAAAPAAAQGTDTKPTGRVVGVLFDDSGSMAQNIQLPTFGVQLLLATLDGREGRDRLLTVRLTDFDTAFDPVTVSWQGKPISRRKLPVPGGVMTPDNIDDILREARNPIVRRWDLADEMGLRRAIETIAATWPKGRAHTAYEPLEILLDAVVDETKPGEEAYLIVLTDGAFYGGAPFLPPDLTDRLKAYRARLQGRLTVFFLLTVNGPDTRQLVERQGVRQALLATFDGKAYEITDFPSMRDALFEVIARVSATEPGLGSTVVRPSGSAIELDLPFTVSRLISLSVGEAGTELPRLDRELPFEPLRRIEVEAAMQGADNQLASPPRIPGWPSVKLAGQVSQVEPSRPLSAGPYRLAYTAPVGDRVQLLFRTEVRLQLVLIGPDGLPVEPGPDGQRKIDAGVPYTLELRVFDRDAEVRTDALPQAIIPTAMVQGNGTAQPLDVKRDPARRRLVATLELDQPGSAEVAANLRLPGFLTTPTERLALTAERRSVEFAITVSCDGCERDEVPFTFATKARAPVPVADVAIIPTAVKPGRFTADLSGDSGFVLLDENGQPLPAGLPLDFTSGNAVKLKLAYLPGWRPTRGSSGLAGVDLVATATAVPDLIGTDRRRITLRPKAPEARLLYVGHSRDPNGGEPLILDLDDLRAGELTLDFVLEDALALPQPDDLDVAHDLPFNRPTTGTDGERIAVFPQLSAFWDWLGCGCVLPLFDRERAVEVDWQDAQGLQRARATTTVQLAPTWWQTAWACIGAFARYALLIWFLGWLVYLAGRARRFPRNSRLVVHEHGSGIPDRPRLRGSWLAHAGRCALWFVPGMRVDESRKLHGLEWVATGGGVRLPARKEWPPFRVRDLGQTLDEIAKLRGETRDIELSWGSVLEERVRAGRRLELVEDAARAS